MRCHCVANMWRPPHTAPLGRANVRTMSFLRVAVVSRDPSIRLQAARAFDAAPASWLVRLYEEEPQDADVVVFGPDSASAEGLVFDPAQPERLLDAIAARAGRARVVVVTGGGRGVGVTTIALHLASISAVDHSTCVVDADPRCGAAHRLGIGEDISGDRPRDLPLAAIPVAGGFRFVVAGDGDRTTEILESAAQMFERVVVDVPDGLHLATLLPGAGAAVMVTTPSPTSVLRAAAVLDAQSDTRWATVLNRIGPGGEVRREQLQRTLGRLISVELPCTPSLRDCEEEQKLLTSKVMRGPRRVADLYQALERV
jgi:MinD-like ATPase involved in chromosome partitioning or flagellar assembly